MAKPLLTKKGFNEWLAKQSDHRTAECGNPQRCVLAQYLADTYGGVAVVTHKNFAAGLTNRQANRPYGEVKFYALPKWALKVVREFDGLRPLYNRSGRLRYSRIRKELGGGS